MEKLSYAKSMEPKEENCIVVVVSRNSREICQILERSSRKLLIDHLIDFRCSEEENIQSSVSPGKTSLLAFDCREISLTDKGLAEKKSLVYEIKARYSSGFPIVAFGPSISAVQHRELLLRAGFDFFVSSDNSDHAVLQMYSVSHRSKVLSEGREYHFSGKHERNLTLGEWTLIVENQSIKMSSGEEISLSKLEWEYLFFLIDRDIRRSDIPENTKLHYEEKINAKAVVYKIKQKVGGKFPIKKTKLRPYYLDLEDT